MGIDLHIDELVLHGFVPRDRHHIAEAVQLELTRLITAAGPAAFVNTQFSMEQIDAGAFNVQAKAKPQQTGTEIAKAVFRTMRQHARAAAIANRTQPARGGRQP